MTNNSHYIRIIIRNALLIAGLFLTFLYQTEMTASRIVGVILLIFAFNVWMINNQKKKTGEDEDQKN